jgi:DNA-binding protein HU-beta
VNRLETVTAIAERTGVAAATVDAVLAGFVSVVTEQVATGGRVQLPGFLTVDTADRAARAGRNPSTGAAMTIPARRVVRVSAGTALKRAAAGG